MVKDISIRISIADNNLECSTDELANLAPEFLGSIMSTISNLLLGRDRHPESRRILLESSRINLTVIDDDHGQQLLLSMPAHQLPPPPMFTNVRRL